VAVADRRLVIAELAIEAHAADVVELQARVRDLEAERDIYRETVAALIDKHHQLLRAYRDLEAELDRRSPKGRR
jgi:hypothetical protein